ncbi:hypothetical protein BDV3_003430 [Batrachochytrium dendrobatidis]
MPRTTTVNKTKTPVTRITQACDSCVRKKCRCDGSQPMCTPCSNSGTQCTYLVSHRKRGPVPAEAKSRSKRLFTAAVVANNNLASASIISTTDFNTHDTQSESLNSHVVSKPSYALEPVSSAMSDVSLLFNPSLAFDGFLSAELANFQQTPILQVATNCALTPKTSTLPLLQLEPIQSNFTSLQKAPIRLELVHIFFMYFHPYFPVLCRERFFENMHRVHQLLLNAMYSVASPYYTYALLSHTRVDQFEPMYSCGDNFYMHARLLVDEHLDNPDMYTVAAVLILAIKSCMTGRGSATWMLLGMAVWMAQQLGLNIDPSILGGFSDHREQDERRALWWICYEVDRSVSGFAGNPGYIKEEEFDVRIPDYRNINEVEDCMECSITPSNIMGCAVLMTAHGHYIHLLRIYTRIITYIRDWLSINTMDPTTCPNTIEQTNIQTLLSEWFSLLPFWMHAFSQPTACGKSPHSDTYFRTYIHIFFQVCIIKVRLPIILHYIAIDGSSWRVAKDYSVVTQAAHAVTSILVELRRQNPFCHYMSPFISYCLSISGMVHALTKQYDKLDIHIEALATLGKFVNLGNLDATMLTTLKISPIDVCVRALKNRLQTTCRQGKQPG